MSDYLPIPQSVGIDIGDHAIKVAVLERRIFPPWNPRPALVAWNSAELPVGVFEHGICKDLEQGAALIRTTLSGATPHAIKRSAAVASIPEAQSFIKTDILAPGKPAEIAAAVRERAAHDFPVALEDVRLEYEVISPAPTGVRVMYGAVERAVAESLQNLLLAAGLIPFALEPEALAIARGLEHLAPADEPFAILDIGARTTSLIIVHHGAIALTDSLPIGSQLMTERISEALKITPEKAEELKRSCGLDPAKCDVKLKPVVTEMLSEMVTETRSAFRFVKQTFASYEHLRHMALVGGAANIAKLDAVLSKELFLKVRRADPAAALKTPPDFPAELGPMLTTAIGLARLGLPGSEHRLRAPARRRRL